MLRKHKIKYNKKKIKIKFRTKEEFLKQQKSFLIVSIGMKIKQTTKTKKCRETDIKLL